MENPKFTAFTRPNGHNEFVEFVNTLPVKDKQKLLSTLKKIEEHGLPVASPLHHFQAAVGALLRIYIKHFPLFLGQFSEYTVCFFHQGRDHPFRCEL